MKTNPQLGLIQLAIMGKKVSFDKIVTESARAHSYYSANAGSISGIPRLCYFSLYEFWLYLFCCTA